MNVAIVHDWLTGMRGGEKVLASICRLFPEADIFTLFHFGGRVSPAIERHRIVTSWLQGLPGVERFYRFYLPLFAPAAEAFDMTGYDLVISTSHCVAKGVIPPRGSLHISYVHTPMRYVWDLHDAYFRSGRSSALASLGMRVFRNHLRRWDVASAPRVDHFVANSRNVRGRIERHYGREAAVIYPPVDVEFFTPGPKGTTRSAFLIVSAMVPYKNIEIAIDAFNRMGLPLRIVGTGPHEEHLRTLAGPTVRFLGWLDDEGLREEYRRCRALIFPGEEDFGIIAVEAQACGRPVIALARGGLLETVEDGRTGVFFTVPATEALMTAIDKFLKTDFNCSDIRENSVRFAEQRFREEFSSFVGEKMHVSSLK